MKRPIANGDFVQSLEKGLDVIRAFNADRRTMSLTEVAKVTGLSRPSARRFLLTLQSLGYVAQENGKFRLRPTVLDLGGAYLSSGELPAVVNPVLTELNEKVREACSVGVWNDDSVLYIARASSQRRIMTFNVQVGTRIDPLTTALGRVLLSALDTDVLEDYLDRRRAANSISDDLTDEMIHAELDSVRQKGWALVTQGVEVGVCAIAAPLRNSSGTVIAGINIAVHMARVSMSRVKTEFLPLLFEAQEEIEVMLEEYGPDFTGY